MPPIFDTAKDTTLVTYYQMPMQHRLAENATRIKGKPYAEFFRTDMYAPLGILEAQKKGLTPSEKLYRPTVADINRMLTQDNPPAAFFGVIDDEDGILSATWSHHFFPKVTSEMMKWWFVWHQVETERYSLWFPHAHVSNRVEHPERLQDPSLGYEEKIYGNPNYIKEYVGETLLDVIIHFAPPESLGVSAETMQKMNFTFSASGWSAMADNPDVPSALMIHLGRDVEGASSYSLPT